MIEEYVRIIELSGIELYATNDLGNSFEVSTHSIAYIADILHRQELSEYERAIMIYGAVHSPANCEEG